MSVSDAGCLVWLVRVNICMNEGEMFLHVAGWQWWSCVPECVPIVTLYLATQGLKENLSNQCFENS